MIQENSVLWIIKTSTLTQTYSKYKIFIINIFQRGYLLLQSPLKHIHYLLHQYIDSVNFKFTQHLGLWFKLTYTFCIALGLNRVIDKILAKISDYQMPNDQNL